MKKTLYSFYIALLPLVISYGQVFNGTDSLFLNEWISFDQDYIKFELAENGMYKVDGALLQSLNFPSNGVTGENLSLFYRGTEIPIHVSTLSNFSEDDFFIFHGQKNDGEIDKYLYEDPDEMQLNPAYSLFNDTSAYYLSWNEETNNQRFEFVENDISGTLPAAETYYLHTEEKVFSNGLVKPTYSGSDNIRYSHFDKTEGFGSSSIPNHSITLTANNIALDGPNANLHVRFATNNTDHLIQANWNNEEISFFDILGLAIIDTAYAFQASSLVGNNVLTLNGTASSSDRISVAFAQLKYPRSFDFNNQNKFFFELNSSSDPMYLEIQNFNGNNDEVLFYDLTNQIWMEAFFDENDQSLKLLLPPSTLKRNCVLVNTASGISNVINSKEVTFIDYSQESYDYVIISNDRLLKDVQGNNENWPQAYADYRNSNAGGNFNSIVVTIDQLYDQFAYGIQFNPLSIKNFTHFIKKFWDNPEYIFIIGKGREYGSFRNANQQAQQWESTFIPTFGLPGGDNLLASAWGSAKPVIPIGRYAAKAPREIQYYLNKVIAHEENVNLGQTIEERQWMKNVLHLSGGSTDIQASIQNYLKNMENVIEDDVFGGHVTTFTKTSSDPIQVTVSDQIFKQINDGLSILTFFGHSAVGTFDFSIENIANYENYGKTFLSFSLGCHSGNIHTNTFGISEEFVVQDGVGAIGFIATSGIAYVSTQYQYAKEFYTYIGKDHYGESIGKASKDIIEIFDNSQSLGTKTFLQQITLHGDPAIRINTQKGPDYIPDYASVQTDPKVVDVYLDSFDVHFDVVNIGQSIPDSFHILIQHIYPDGTEGPQVELYEPSPKYADSYTVSIPILSENIIGRNLIYITADSKNLIAELPDTDAENNNELRNNAGQKGYPFYVLDNSAVPVGPKEFSIVSEIPVTLYASTYNATGEKSDFIIQIDTTEYFNSELLSTTKIEDISGLIRWKPNIDFEANEEYYWRISPDSTDAEIGFVWKYSSFTYIPDSGPGWSQSDYFQFLKDDFENLEVDQDDDFKFTVNLNDFHITNKVWEPGNPPIVYINSKYCKNCLWFPYSPSIVLVVIDGDGNIVEIPAEGEYGGVNHWDSPKKGRYYYINEDTTRHALMDYIENHIEVGHQVMLYTVLANENSDLQIEEWANDSLVYGKNIFSVLEEQGATLIRDLQTYGNVPYIFSFVKGENVITELIATNPSQTIESVISYNSRWFEGSLNSTMIGPSTKWDKVIWDHGMDFNSETDSISVSIIGIDTNDILVPILEYSNEKELDISSIDPKQYPKLMLRFDSNDETFQSSADLEYWRVLYDGTPEAALNISESFSFHADTLQRGDIFKFKIHANNLSNYNLDSVLVRFILTDENNNTIELTERLAPLIMNDSLFIDFSYNTKDLTGLYQFSIEINPDKEQAECFYINNLGFIYFQVEDDRRNPVIDVTFDGVHIIDGDIVSPSPQIHVDLKDENPFLLIQDTSSISLFLSTPNGTKKQLPLNDPSIQFYPAENAENHARLEFNPNFEQEGIYIIEISAKDVSGNVSGNQNYSVSFEIILEQMISNVLNYPNPFSNSTQFIFTLTGEEIPEYLKIQIMTVSGKVVREILKEELGPLKIGLNRTEYKWNGTDDLGGKLANGVYLYRVVSKDQSGKEINKFETNTNEFFKNNIGKLVILR